MNVHNCNRTLKFHEWIFSRCGAARGHSNYFERFLIESDWISIRNEIEFIRICLMVRVKMERGLHMFNERADGFGTQSVAIDRRQCMYRNMEFSRRLISSHIGAHNSANIYHRLP